MLSLATGFEVAELDLLTLSPLASVTAPWQGPASEELPIRWQTNAIPHWQSQVARRLVRFQAVYLSPRFDPLPPCPAVQTTVAEWLHLCARLGILCWLQTRGAILPQLWKTLGNLQEWVRVSLAFCTMDSGLSRALEPGAAPPSLRWRQFEQLRQLGVPVQVTLAPLIPGLTDHPDNLLPLLANLVQRGVKRATAGYLLLDPLAELHNHRRVRPQGWAQPLEDLYQSGPLRRWGPDQLARHLPYRERQKRYATIIALASQFDIEIRPNTLADPDFRPGLSPSEQLVLSWPTAN